jgi:hypothetical protein
MNEDEWFSEVYFTRHLDFVEDRLSARKTRLLAAAFCREVLPLFNDQRHRDAVDAAEDFADGKRSPQELEEHRKEFREEATRTYERYKKSSEAQSEEALKWFLSSELAWAISYTTTAYTPLPLQKVGQAVVEITTRTRTGESSVVRTNDVITATLNEPDQLGFRALVHDVVGNPFRPIEFLVGWRSGNTIALARGMYDSRDFSAMPILADALEDAGCDNATILEHCRGDTKHVRGCWVVDQVLGLQ